RSKRDWSSDVCSSDLFQNEILNDEKRQEIKGIENNINETDIEKLKDRLNNEILVSKNALQNEMVMIQAFLFTDSGGPDVNYIDSDSRAKLEAYLTFLENSYLAIREGTKAEVTILEYKDAPDNVREHVLESTLEIEKIYPDFDEL